MYSEIVQSPQFYLDNCNYYPDATSFIMTGKNIKYLVNVLNNNIIHWLFKKYYAGGGLGNNGVRYKKAFLENLPIPIISDKNVFQRMNDIVLEENVEIDKDILYAFHFTRDEIYYISSIKK